LFLDVSIGYLKDQPLSPPAQTFLDNLETLRTSQVGFQGIDHLLEAIPLQTGGKDH
jgi:hypothetical protein